MSAAEVNHEIITELLGCFVDDYYEDDVDSIVEENDYYKICDSPDDNDISIVLYTPKNKYKSHDRDVPRNTCLYEMIHAVCVASYSTKQLIWKNKIDSMTEGMIKSVLKMFKRLKKNPSITQMNKKFLYTFLKKWPGFTKESVTKKHAHILYLNLFKYLQDNWKKVDPIVKAIVKLKITDEVKSTNILVECSYGHLKHLFLSQPTQCDIFNLSSKVFAEENSDMFLESVLNYPFVGVHIDLPGFRMVRYNNNHNEFKLIDVGMCKNFKPDADFPLNTELFCSNNDSSEAYSSSFIILFILGLKVYLDGKEEIPMNIKDSVFIVLNELMKDLKYADGMVKTKISFFKYFSLHPYFRCFANYTTSNKDILDKNLFIQLQETVYPGVMFQLEKFSPLVIKINNEENFVFQTHVYEKKVFTDCLTYICLLHKLKFKTKIAFFEHLNTHGVEIPWICCKCNKIYPIDQLTSQRWEHEC